MMPDDTDSTLPERLRAVVALACDAAAQIEALEAELTWRDLRISAMGREVTAANTEVDRLRDAIRSHRDQIGDDRCWLDDSRLYGVLPEGGAYDSSLPPRCEFLESCSRYFDQRQSPEAKGWRVNEMTIAQLHAEIGRLRAIVTATGRNSEEIDS